METTENNIVIEMMHFRLSCLQMALDHHRLEGNTTQNTNEIVETANKFMKFIKDGESENEK